MILNIICIRMFHEIQYTVAYCISYKVSIKGDSKKWQNLTKWKWPKKRDILLHGPSSNFTQTMTNIELPNHYSPSFQCVIVVVDFFLFHKLSFALSHLFTVLLGPSTSSLSTLVSQRPNSFVMRHPSSDRKDAARQRLTDEFMTCLQPPQSSAQSPDFVFSTRVPL